HAHRSSVGVARVNDSFSRCLVMDRMWMGLALAGMMAFGSHAQDSVGPAEALPPAAWLQGDPADSVYRAARAALDRRDYRQAADLFAQVPARYPRSGYAADA